MKKHIATFAALCALSAAAFACTASAQTPPPPKAHHELTVQERVKADAERIARDYGMNERQYKKVYRLLLKIEMMKEDASEGRPMMKKPRGPQIRHEGHPPCSPGNAPGPDGRHPDRKHHKGKRP